jgi:gas vesicle protein
MASIEEYIRTIQAAIQPGVEPNPDVIKAALGGLRAEMQQGGFDLERDITELKGIQNLEEIQARAAAEGTKAVDKVQADLLKEEEMRKLKAQDVADERLRATQTADLLATEMKRVGGSLGTNNPEFAALKAEMAKLGPEARTIAAGIETDLGVAMRQQVSEGIEEIGRTARGLNREVASDFETRLRESLSRDPTSRQRFVQAEADTMIRESAQQISEANTRAARAPEATVEDMYKEATEMETKGRMGGGPEDIKKAGELREKAGARTRTGKTMKGVGIGGAISAAALLMLAPKIFGKKSEEAKLPPEVQMQLMAQLMQNQGAAAKEQDISTGRQLSNSMKVLNMIKIMKDMQAVNDAPQATPLAVV